MAIPAFQTNTSELETLLKTVYAPAIEQQQNLEPMAYKLFKKSSRPATGSKYEFPARMGMPQSMGNRGARSALPTPRATTDVTAEVRQKFFYATGDVTGPDLAKGKGNVGAFVDVETDKMDAIVSSAFKDLNFQFYLGGDGGYARIVSLPGTVSKVGVDTIKYLRANRRVDLWDDSGTVIGEASGTNNRAIMALTIEGGVPTVQFKNDSSGAALARDGSQGGGFVAAAPDLIIPETALAGGSAAAGLFFHGLKAIVDDGSVYTTFQNISRTTYPLWKAKVFSNGGSAQPLTLKLVRAAIDIPKIMSGMPIDLVLGSPNARNLYEQLLVSQKRYHENKQTGDGLFEELACEGKRFVVDIDCQDDRIYFLNKKSIEYFGLMDLKFDESDGAILKHGGLTTGDVYYFYLKVYANFGTNRCNANAVITDLEVDSNYLLAA